MTRTVTPKLVRSAWLAAVLLYVAIVTGRLELVALAAPIVLALTGGVASSRTPSFDVSCSVDLERCLEGDTVTATLLLRSDMHEGEVHLALQVPGGFEDPEGAAASALSLHAGEERVVEVPLRAVRWGTYRVGYVAVRIYGPGGYLVFEEGWEQLSEVKVFPRLERISRGLHPPETHVFSGSYVSRAASHGIEFAHVRPYEPGDRVRHVNWRVTSRRGDLHVNVAHPELNTDIALFLDTFGDHGEGDPGSLEVAVRGAAGVARHYLRTRDRVALVSFGGIVSWLTASMGRTQVYRIVDQLLASRALFSYAWKDIELLPRGTIPPGALVIAFSPLVDRRAIGALGDLTARRFPLVVVDTLQEERVTPEPSPEGVLAHRVWRMQRAALRSEFGHAGVPVLRWNDDEGLDLVLAAVGRIPSLRGALR